MELLHKRVINKNATEPLGRVALVCYFSIDKYQCHLTFWSSVIGVWCKVNNKDLIMAKTVPKSLYQKLIKKQLIRICVLKNIISETKIVAATFQRNFNIKAHECALKPFKVLKLKESFFDAFPINKYFIPLWGQNVPDIRVKLFFN